VDNIVRYVIVKGHYQHTIKGEEDNCTCSAVNNIFNFIPKWLIDHLYQESESENKHNKNFQVLRVIVSIILNL